MTMLDRIFDSITQLVAAHSPSGNESEDDDVTA
jgi:hypothetical protein